MGKHTEGPWKTTPTYSHVYRDEKTGPCGVICKMPDASYPLQWIATPASLENSANARLIAATPDMLEALELAQATIERLNRHNSADGTLSVIKEAIKKAHGHD